MAAGEFDEAKWLAVYSKNCGPLHRLHYYRVVFDEGHLIKNFKTKGFRAAYALRASRRWILTGTPIIDATEEVFSYFRLLRVPSTGKIETFRKNYCNINNSLHPLRLTEALKPYVFRRTHDDSLFGTPILNLPDKDQYELLCKQTPFERAVHVALVENYTKMFESSPTSMRKGLVLK